MRPFQRKVECDLSKGKWCDLFNPLPSPLSPSTTSPRRKESKRVAKSQFLYFLIYQYPLWVEYGGLPWGRDPIFNLNRKKWGKGWGILPQFFHVNFVKKREERAGYPPPVFLCEFCERKERKGSGFLPQFLCGDLKDCKLLFKWDKRAQLFLSFTKMQQTPRGP